MIREFMLASDWEKIRWFTPLEFDHPEKASRELIFKLDRFRNGLGLPIKTTSSGRPLAQNEMVGGYKKSAHLFDDNNPWEAVDCFCPKLNVIEFWLAAEQYGWTNIGLYQSKTLHLDERDRDANGKGWRWTSRFCNCTIITGKNADPNCPTCKGKGQVYTYPITQIDIEYFIREVV